MYEILSQVESREAFKKKSPILECRMLFENKGEKTGNTIFSIFVNSMILKRDLTVSPIHRGL